jgi:hypothetical protein
MIHIKFMGVTSFYLIFLYNTQQVSPPQEIRTQDFFYEECTIVSSFNQHGTMNGCRVISSLSSEYA